MGVWSAGARNPRASAADLVAGLSIAGLLLPEAVAYSGIAGLPPQAGIIGLFAGLIAYGLLGTSRFAIVAATSSSAAVLGAAITTIAAGRDELRPLLALVLVLLTGLYFVLASAARLGNVTDFISKPVLRGFTFGLGLVIVVGQFSAMVQLRPSYPDPVRRLFQLGGHIDQWNLTSLLVGICALCVLFVLSRWRSLPAGLVAVALGLAATRFGHLQDYGVRVVGPIHLELHAPSLPELRRDEWLRLAELALALVMVLYSESYGAIRNFAMKHGDEVRPNRDLLALGASNLLSGAFLGMPVGAGYSATSANEAAGAASRWSGGIAALAMLLVVLFILPLIAYTPEAVLAAIVIHAVSHSLSPAVFRRYFVWRRDRLVAAAAVVAVLWLGVLDGLMIAIAVSVLMMLRRLSVSTISELGRLGDSHDFVSSTRLVQARPEPGLLILRPDEPVFFGNAERLFAEVRRRTLAADRGVRAVIVSLEETYDLDGTSIEALQDLAAWMHKAGRRLVFARLKPPVLELLEAALNGDAQGPLLVDRSVDDAVIMAKAAIQEGTGPTGKVMQ